MITITLHINGEQRQIRTMAGATVEIALTASELWQVESGERLLREFQGAFVPLNMPAVDGLLLELVPFAEGEGPLAQPAKFTINRFGELVSRDELQQIKTWNADRRIDIKNIRLDIIRQWMRS